MSRLIIVGSRGYIGKHLLQAAAPMYDIIATTSFGANGSAPLDLMHPEIFDYSIIQPGDTCLLTAAISSPDLCNNKSDVAYGVNVVGTSYFIRRLLDIGCKVILFSSDTVYGEHSFSFDEGRVCNPCGVYAEMKYEVEKLFLSHSLFKTIRISYVFSREDKLTQYLIRCNEMGQEAELFDPFYRAIVHRMDVVAGAINLAIKWDQFPEKIINFAGPEVLSRAGFAECLKEIALPSLQYIVSSPEPEFFSKRPRFIAMTSIVFERLLGRAPCNLKDASRIEFSAHSNLEY